MLIARYGMAQGHETAKGSGYDQQEMERDRAGNKSINNSDVHSENKERDKRWVCPPCSPALRLNGARWSFSGQLRPIGTS